MGKPTIRFDTERLALDMAERGWMASDLARVAGVDHSTVSRFMNGEIQTARTANKFAYALGFKVRRYVLAAKVVA